MSEEASLCKGFWTRCADNLFPVRGRTLWFTKKEKGGIFCADNLFPVRGRTLDVDTLFEDRNIKVQTTFSPQGDEQSTPVKSLATDCKSIRCTLQKLMANS